MGGAANVAPDVTGVKSGTDTSGRSKVQVNLTNGALMRYQWQFKNTLGEWEDIFGATGSHYTLGRQFAAGKEYELRARITNPAGSTSFSDSVKVTVEGSASAGLQSKENGNFIEEDQVMDGAEEIPVANTATNGQFLAVVGILVVIAAVSMLAVALRRRR